MMAERGLSLAHTTIMRGIERYVPEFEKRWNRFARQAGGSCASMRPTSRSRVAGLISTAPSTGPERPSISCSAPSEILRPPKRSSVERSRPKVGCRRRSRSTAIKLRTEAAREFLAQHQGGARTKIRSSKYLNNLIEQDHRSIKLRLGPMLGLKRFRNSSITIAGIELVHRIRKGQFKLGRLRIKDNRAPEIWNAVLAA